MKKYIEPLSHSISMNVETGILAGSDAVNVFDKGVSGSGEGVGDQYSQKKGAIWKDSKGKIWE